MTATQQPIQEGWQTSMGHALMSKWPKIEWSMNGEEAYENITWINLNGETKPTEAEIKTEWDRLQAAYDANAYGRNRQPEYPAIGEQLDNLYHAIDGDAYLKAKFADFHSAIKAVKDKYPKSS